MDHPWRVKHRRADEHIARFAAACDEYLREAHVALRHEVDAGTVRVRLHADAEPPPGLGAIVGDALHNLRSALDSVAWAACHRGGAAPKQEHRIYFPIDHDPARWGETARGKLPGVTGDDLEVFRHLQPWWWDQVARDGGVAVPVAQAKTHPLWRLHDLARVDRHRLVHPVLARAGHHWLGHAEGVTVDLAVDRATGARPGEVCIEWRVDPPEAAARVEPGGEVVLALGEAPGRLPPRRALDDLRAMQRAAVEATRRVEVEVLGVVSDEDLDALAALARASREAESELTALLDADHVIDQDYMDRYAAAEAADRAARGAYAALWSELFD